MLDVSRVEDLMIVRKIREKIRKWWKVEIFFADEKGYVPGREPQGSGLLHSANPICRASLTSKTGFHHCNQSFLRTVDYLRVHRRIHAHLEHHCYMGFPFVAVPIVYQGQYRGVIIAGGFILEEQQKLYRLVVEQRLREYRSAEWQLGGDPFREVPVLSHRDIDYLSDLLETTVEEMISYYEELQKNQERITQLNNQLGDRYQFGNILGKSDAMQKVFGLLEKVAPSPYNVLVLGENGTGKELVARAIHFNSVRRTKPLVVQNCSAINDNLLESEFFGHVRGAFTGAVTQKKGLFQAADGGTFFLDEVGEMTAAMQAKLLRVLQEGTFIPVGATEPVHVDVRVIAATNRDLKALVAQGLFREDLFYRLSILVVQMPPLRERSEDVPLLANYFLQQAAVSVGTPPPRLSKEVLERLYAYRWPGNVRELETEIERLVTLSSGASVITEEYLSPKLKETTAASAMTDYRKKGTLGEAVNLLERDMIEQGLLDLHWNKSKLARQLGLSRATLIKKIKEYRLEPRD